MKLNDFVQQVEAIDNYQVNLSNDYITVYYLYINQYRKEKGHENYSVENMNYLKKICMIDRKNTDVVVTDWGSILQDKNNGNNLDTVKKLCYGLARTPVYQR